MNASIENSALIAASRLDGAILVSVMVITFNSARTILETLESILLQSYQKIELVISDDGSKDETLLLCENWLKDHQDRFFRSQILSVQENTGVSENCLRGVNASRGEWIKIIAGDDILAKNCIETLLSISLDINCKVLVSDLKCFTSNAEYDYPYYQDERRFFFNLSVEEKYKYYLWHPFFLNIPSIFYKREVFALPGIFNTKYKLLEDQPMLYTILKNKVDIHYAPVRVVFYRIHESSITGKINPAFQKALYECYKEYRRPNIKNSIKGLLFKRMTELAFYVNIQFPEMSFKDRAVRKLHEILKNSLQPFLRY